MTLCFVTGAAGQDGSYLCEQLLREGYDVVGSVRPEETPSVDPGPDGGTQGTLRYVTVDFEVPGQLRSALLDCRPDHVYNLAGVSSVAQSWSDPARTVTANCTAVAELLEACWQLRESASHEVSVVQASSGEIFAGSGVTPQRASTPVRPTSPYGASKACAHHLVQSFRARGLTASNVILYNHESPRRPPSFVTRKITQGAAHISLGLSDRLTLGNISARRDWGWAPDYVDCMVRAQHCDRPGDFIVATGESHSVAEFAETAFRHVGIADWRAYVSLDPQLERPTDALDLVGDATETRSALGWQPTVSFDEIVARMVAHDVQVALTTPQDHTR